MIYELFCPIIIFNQQYERTQFVNHTNSYFKIY